MSQTKAQLIDNLAQALNFTGTASAPANGVFLSAANTLALATNSAQRLTIDSSGNVGIGTTSPAVELHVQSSGDTIVRVTSADGSAAFLDLGDASDPDGGRIHYDSGSNLVFNTASTERMRIDSSGNVGIGTNSPDSDSDHYALTIRGKASTGAGMLSFIDTSGNKDGFIFADNGSLFFTADSSNATADSTIRFRVDGSSEKMRIDSSGKVGIGTTSPSGQLHVQNSSVSDTKITIESTGTNSYPAFRVKNDARSYDLGIDGGSDSFRIFDVSANTQRITLDPTGRFAINGAGTKGMLEVRASGGATDQLTAVFGANEGTTAGTLTDNADKACRIGIQHYDTDAKPFAFLVGSSTSSDNNLSFGGGTSLMNGANYIRFLTDTGATNNGGTERMRIDSSGNVVLNSATARVYNGHTPKFSVQGTNYSQSTVAITSNSADGNGAYLFFAKQRSGAVGGSTSVANGDMVGQFRYLAGDGTDVQSEVANITVNIDGTPGSNDTPGRIMFATTNDGGNTSTERMRINSEGNVGIGTSSPSEKLSVKGGNVDLTARFDNSRTGDGNINYIGVSLDGGGRGIALFGHTGHSTAGSQAAWMGCGGDDVAGGTGVKAFRGGDVQMNGKLRINTGTQYGKLHVLEGSFNPGNSDWLTEVSYVASGSFGGGYSLLDGSKGYSMYCHGSGANFSIQHHSSTTASASGGVQLTNGATSWTGMSDERDKENLVTISDAITKIKTLRTVTGNYIWQPDVKHAFLIAQDVQAVLPEAVDIMNTYEETEKQRLGLRYTEVIPLLTAALQEAVAEIDTLKTKVAALEAAQYYKVKY